MRFSQHNMPDIMLIALHTVSASSARPINPTGGGAVATNHGSTPAPCAGTLLARSAAMRREQREQERLLVLKQHVRLLSGKSLEIV
jgi:uncharacterized protein (DUF111 family)